MKHFKLHFVLFFIKFYFVACFNLLDSTSIIFSEGNDTRKSQVEVYVNSLDSEYSLIPYDYNHFDFCAVDESESFFENLVQIMLGEKIRLSHYNMSFLKDVNCGILCEKTYDLHNADDIAKIRTLQQGILKSYQHHWIVDGLPVTLCIAVEDNSKFCSDGFPIGCYISSNGVMRDGCIFDPITFHKRDTFYLFNHVDIQIKYQTSVEHSHRGTILQITVQPRSIKNQGCTEDRRNSLPMEFPNDLKIDNLTIYYTYSVKFIKYKIPIQTSRWHHCMEFMPFANAPWPSLLFSFMIMLVPSCIVAIILLRTLHKKRTYNNPTESAYTSESPRKLNWELIDGDVFRFPQKKLLLSIMLGSGVQLIVTTLVTLIIFTYNGFLSSNYMHIFIRCAMGTYACFACIAGSESSKMYRALGGVNWKLSGALTSSLCSGCIFLSAIVINLTLWTEESISSASFTILLGLLLFWFGTSSLLTYAGAYIGFTRGAIDYPVQTNEIPRQIPKQPIYTRPIFSFLLGGFLPFSCVFFQLYFVLTSIWTSGIYCTFGFLILLFILLLVTCAESSIIMCYYHLRTGDYHWWWRSFLTSGSTAFYMFLYFIHYFVTKLAISDNASIFLYFVYSLIMTFLIFLSTGTIGFFACFWFVRKIYGASKDIVLQDIPLENKKGMLSIFTIKLKNKIQNSDFLKSKH